MTSQTPGERSIHSVLRRTRGERRHMLGSYLLVIVAKENFKWCLNLSSSAV